MEFQINALKNTNAFQKQLPLVMVLISVRYLPTSVALSLFNLSVSVAIKIAQKMVFTEKKMISFFKSLGKVLRGIRENSLIIIRSPMMHRLRYIQEYMLITPSGFFKYLQRDSCHFKNDSLVFPLRISDSIFSNAINIVTYDGSNELII